MNKNFITFEGSDGAGKTTALDRVVATLNDSISTPILRTREPGGDRISEQIRNVILNRDNDEIDAKTEALLYAAARRQHLVMEVLPALAKHQLVFCDRYLDSSLAYQGGGRQLGVQAVNDMNQFATGGLTPGLTIYFDLPVEIGLKRIADNRSDDEVNRLDVEEVSFYKRVHETYNQLALDHPERIVKVDATQQPDQVYDAVLTILRDYLNRSDK
ncbi:dTMP kinase [Nicoliella sp. Es01]|uniref:Thymidylate kinase n=2 Tax=Nicoliella lavandulae TaxID=3082954 RepID=A0ABU8SK05_9LACO